METRIDDAIARGDVSFVYEMHKVFIERIVERVNYVTNLLNAAEFDFSVDESYTWKRKDAAWPTTVDEQNELWRKRIKNEMLSIVLSRQLDKEEAEKEEAEKAEKKSENKAGGKKEEKKSDEDDFKEPELSPKDNLLKRYRQYVQVLTEPDEEVVFYSSYEELLEKVDAVLVECEVLRLTEIAEKLGYYDASYFSKIYIFCKRPLSLISTKI